MTASDRTVGPAQEPDERSERPSDRYVVDVDGGELSVRDWPTEDGGSDRARVVLGAHGVTSTGAIWQLVADALPGVRLLAPDLRGHGRSNGLPGPYGLVQQADDLARVLDAFDLDRVVFVGHSLGAFAGVRFAERHRDRLHALVLVDGGLPAGDGAGDRSHEELLGPAVERLARTFASREEYLDFWRPHPAIGPLWSDAVERVVLDGLQGEGPYRASAHPEAVAETLADLSGRDGYRDALVGLTVPTTFIRPGAGLLGGEPLYDAATAASWLRFLRAVTTVEAEDESHYSLLLGEAGARLTAGAVRRQVDVAVAREAARAAHPATGRIRVIAPEGGPGGSSTRS